MANERESGTGKEKGKGEPSPSRETEFLSLRYDRSRRIERAPAEARWLEARRGAGRAGLLSSLFATRASRMLFAVIVGLALVFFAAPLLEGKGGASARLGGATWSLEALSFEGKVLLVLSRQGGDPAPGGQLEVATRLSTGGIDRRSFILAGGEREEFRYSLEAPAGKPAKLEAVISLGEASANLEVPVR